jgi:hypothetical protein
MLGLKAMALAPTIGSIPDIIIGDEEQGTPTNVFVFPDAVNLDGYVSDDSTTPGAIIWSYSILTEPTLYTINGVAPLDPATEDPNVPGSKRIDTTDDDPVTSDSNARTITLRDESRSPVATGSGRGPYDEPDTSGNAVVLDSRTVTLHASDGSTFSSKSIIVYTEDDGADRYSPPEDIVLSIDFRTGLPSGWTFSQAGGTVTQSQNATDGICLNVGLTGDNDGNYSSANQSIELVSNSVWEARMTVSTDQTTVKATPLWMLVYDNFGGQDEYGGEHFYLDNEGGTNSPIAGTGRSDFKCFMMPIAMQTPQFSSETDGMFSSALDATNDFRVVLRIFDIGSAGYGASLDSGTVCFQDLTIVRHDLDDMQVLESDTYGPISTFVDALSDNTQPGSYQVDTFGGTSIAFAGHVTLSPAGGTGWNTGDIALLHPGDNTAVKGATPENVSDNWPITWTGDTLYYIQYEVSAPTATDESNPPDVIRVGADVITDELVTDHFAVPNTPDLSSGFNTRGISMPRAGTPQAYACFFYSHSETSSSMPPNNGLDWRPRFEVLNSSGLNPLGRTTNTGSVRVHSAVVQTVDF